MRIILTLRSRWCSCPFLITENMWPRGCVLDCQRGRHRPVCGSNGRLYKSLCAFQRAQCINTQLRHVPRGHCTKCQLARAQGFEARARSRGSPAAAVFVPACSPEGHFMPIQCHNQTGYCWCSTIFHMLSSICPNYPLIIFFFHSLCFLLFQMETLDLDLRWSLENLQVRK
uniref:Kazal-like domain-containing protein n=1 Tax=Neolamprologus brichardi TaxID=32507 RepID=A0A3Q4GGJ0_NEOBR